MQVVASDATFAPTNQEALPPRRRMKSIALITRRINPITANGVPNPMSRCHAIHPAPMTRKRTPIESSRLSIDLTLGVWQIPPVSRNPDGQRDRQRAKPRNVEGHWRSVTWKPNAARIMSTTLKSNHSRRWRRRSGCSNHHRGRNAFHRSSRPELQSFVRQAEWAQLFASIRPLVTDIGL